MDNNEGEDIVPKGNEWEVVALTESAYAAAPGPYQGNVDTTSDGSFIGDDSSETTGTMFMSAHFGVVPSITTEKLPLESGKDILKSDEAFLDSKRGSKDDESVNIEALISDEFHGTPEFNEKAKTDPFYSSDYRDDASSTLMEKEQSIYDEAAAVFSDVLNESMEVPELIESPMQAMNQARSNVQKNMEGDNANQTPDNASESWWRRRAFSLYELVKSADPFWSVVVAATLMGVVIIGQRWHQDKAQLIHLKSHLVINEKGSSWVLRPVTRLEIGNCASHSDAHIKFASLAEI